MYYVILADGTRIDNCTETTTSNEIYAVRDSFAAAAAVMDLFTKDNCKTVQVFNENNELVTMGSDLSLNPGMDIHHEEDAPDYIACVTLRNKSEMEVLQDQIAELQDAVINLDARVKVLEGK